MEFCETVNVGTLIEYAVKRADEVPKHKVPYHNTAQRNKEQVAVDWLLEQMVPHDLLQLALRIPEVMDTDVMLVGTYCSCSATPQEVLQAAFGELVEAFQLARLLAENEQTSWEP